MKRSIIAIVLVFFSAAISAQVNADAPEAALSNGIYIPDNLFASNFSQAQLFEHSEELYLSESERLNFLNHNAPVRPLPPILTTNASDLEICHGSSTRLTANSAHMIYWYVVPPPVGTPVGTGTSFITPTLNTGYYTYYAVAENNGIRSEITAMEVVMVYPSPTLSIVSSTNRLCAKETATLTVSGTTYYEWENGPVASQMTIRPVNTQTYRVTGINTAGCKSTAEFTQNVELCSSEEGEDAVNAKQFSFTTNAPREDKLSVFPNPNNGVFTVQLPSISENTKVEIYNWLGTLTYSIQVTSQASVVELKDAPNGIYTVRVFENNTLLSQQKIVKE